MSWTLVETKRTYRNTSGDLILYHQWGKARHLYMRIDEEIQYYSDNEATDRYLAFLREAGLKEKENES